MNFIKLYKNRFIKLNIPIMNKKRNLTTTSSEEWINGLSKTSHYFKDEHHSIHCVNIKKYNIKENELLNPIFMLHGAIENRKIFYSDTGKGLACYLANNNYNVFIIDYRGRGKSTPSIDEDSNHGQTEVIQKTIPSTFDFIKNQTKNINNNNKLKQIWISHSWGGVCMTSAMAYKPDMIKDIACQIHFGTKFDIKTRNWNYLTQVLIGYSFLMPLLSYFHNGSCPCHRYGIGSDGETLQMLQQCGKWIKGDVNTHWYDDKKGYEFNYNDSFLKNIKNQVPGMHVYALGDKILGHPNDVKRWAQYTNQTQCLLELDKSFDHINMLTHKKCEIKDGKVDSNKIEQDGDSLEIKRSSGHFHDVMNFIKKYA